MPAPRKVDLLPPELRARLAEALAARGFGDIVAVTESLNVWLEERGLELRLGKTAVGEFSKLLKDQREAFGMAETLLADMDVSAESEMHRTLMQMIATSAMHMMRAVRDEDEHLDAKSLMSLGRMLKDLMQSAGIREQLLAAHTRAQAARLEAAVEGGDIDAEAAAKARRILGFG